MFMDWKNFIKSYISTGKYVPENTSIRKPGTFIFFILLGYITAFSLIARVEGKTDITHPNRSENEKIQKIQGEIEKIRSENASLESEILILNYNLSQLLERQEKQEILKLSTFTGTHKKMGPGIIIKLTDSDKIVGLKDDPNIGLIHNADLLELINDLWAAKAEAISLNEQRIISKTGIRCIGSTILVNEVRIAPPFVIKAVGSPEDLEKSVKNGRLQTLELSGIKYLIEKYNRLEILANDNIILAGDF